jgi:hypothetical protein
MSPISTTSRFSYGTTTFQAGNNANKDELDVDSAAAPNTKKRKAYPQDGSQGKRPSTVPPPLTNSYIARPIIINDSDSPKQSAFNRGFLEKKRRRNRESERPFQQILPADDFLRVKKLLRSSKKIFVISGAGISANAGSKLDFIYKYLY